VIGFKTFTVKIDEAIVRSEPEKAISCLSDGGNAAGAPHLEPSTPVIQLVKALAMMAGGAEVKSNATARYPNFRTDKAVTAYVLVGETQAHVFSFVRTISKQNDVLCLGQILPNVRPSGTTRVVVIPSKEVMHPTAIE